MPPKEPPRPISNSLAPASCGSTARAAPVSTWARPSTAARTRAGSASNRTTASSAPGCPQRARASASENQTPVPSACPTTRNSRFPTGVSSDTRSPADPAPAPVAVAVAAPSTTSSAATGARPRPSRTPVKADAPQPEASTAGPAFPRTGKTTSGTARPSGASRSSRAASTRARSGTRTDSSYEPSPLPTCRRICWSAATTTGAWAYRVGGRLARAPLSSRMPQAETMATVMSRAMKVPAKAAGRKRTAARARPLGRSSIRRPLPRTPGR